MAKTKEGEVDMGKAVLIHPGIGPWWFHHHGIKMQLVQRLDQPGTILIANNAASVEITPFQAPSPHYDALTWNVAWRVRFCPFSEASGNCLFTDEDLRCAFQLRDSFHEQSAISHSEWLTSTYGGTVGNQGRFLRHEQYLVIPAPGMAHDGVAAVSIELDHEIRRAVLELLKSLPRITGEMIDRSLGS